MRKIFLVLLVTIPFLGGCSVSTVQGGPTRVFILPPQGMYVRVWNGCAPLMDIMNTLEGTVVTDLPLGNSERILLVREQPFGSREVPLLLTFKSEGGVLLGSEEHTFKIDPRAVDQKIWRLSPRNSRRGWGGCQSRIAFYLDGTEEIILAE